jgi:hypothetical protein
MTSDIDVVSTPAPDIAYCKLPGLCFMEFTDSVVVNNRTSIPIPRASFDWLRHSFFLDFSLRTKAVVSTPYRGSTEAGS